MNDEVWTKNLLYKHYHQYRKMWTNPGMDILESLRREHWRQVRIQIAQEIEALIPTVLRPPEYLREDDPETLTVVDVLRTDKTNYEPLR